MLGIFSLLDAPITQEAYEYTGDVLAVSYAQRLKTSVRHIQMENMRLTRANLAKRPKGP